MMVLVNEEDNKEFESDVKYILIEYDTRRFSEIFYARFLNHIDTLEHNRKAHRCM